MPRKKRKSFTRTIKPDAVYNDVLVAKFINCMMWDGKKGVSERIFYKAMDIIKEKTNEDPYSIFQKALENVKPSVEVRMRKIGGATYQIPVPIRPERRNSLAIRWLIRAARERREKDMHNKLAAELLDAYKNTGGAIKKKEDTRKMAEANKAFSHYKW